MVSAMSGQAVRKTGSRRAKNPPVKRTSKPHVISLRVSDREKQLLEQISRKRCKNLSMVVREALEDWLAR